MVPIVTTLTIPGQGFISAGAALPAPGVFAIEVDGPWTAAPISFLVAQDGLQTWLDAGYEGNEIVLPITPGQRIQFDSELWSGVGAIKVRSGTVGSPVIQTADTRILVISSAGTPVYPPAEPNPRRTIYAECYGYVGTFTPYWTTDSDVATFDLTFILATGETVTEVTEFDVTPEAGIDLSPASRVLGPPNIVGNTVNQRFGNWQTGISQILYRINMTCTTSLGNTISVYAYVYVNAPPDAGCC